MNDNFRKLRLQEFNDFDIERLLKKVIDGIEEENEKRLNFIEENQHVYSGETIRSMSEVVNLDSAEIVFITSLLTHTDNIYSYFANGPLFRKDRDAE